MKYLNPYIPGGIIERILKKIYGKEMVEKKRRYGDQPIKLRDARKKIKEE